MTSEIFLQTLGSGVLIGLIYALVAIGLTMIFGVMDIVNFSHGEFLMLGMYSTFWMYSLYALDPMYSLPITAVALFVLGVVLYQVTTVRLKAEQIQLVSGVFVVGFAGIGLQGA